MQDTSSYIPMNALVKDTGNQWTFTHIDIPYCEIARKGVVLWCTSNIKGRWTMLGGNKFGFEDHSDAVIFRLQFSRL